MYKRKTELSHRLSEVRKAIRVAEFKLVTGQTDKIGFLHNDLIEIENMIELIREDFED